MESVFVYWDNSNSFHDAQRFAIERKEGSNIRYRVSAPRPCCGWHMPIGRSSTRRPWVPSHPL